MKTRLLITCVLASAASTLTAGDAEPIKAVTDGAVREIGLAVTAALAIALCVMGAAHAVARVGSAALGAAAEKPELLTKSLLFVALAEGLAVLGFAIAMMILQKI